MNEALRSSLSALVTCMELLDSCVSAPALSHSSPRRSMGGVSYQWPNGGSGVPDLSDVPADDLERAHEDRVTDNLLVVPAADDRRPEKVRPILVPPNSSPWLTATIVNKSRARNKAYKRWRRSRGDVDLTLYRSLRGEVRRMIVSAKVGYDSSQLDPLLPSGKLWKNIGHLGITRQSGSAPDDVSADDLNAFFAGSGAKHSSPFFCPVGVAASFNFRNVDYVEVYSAFCKISSNASGHDGMQINFLKPLLHIILPYICDLYNFCITTSTFPLEWKHAIVTPIPKIARPTSVSDFRPISILPCLSKLFEHLLKDQIEDYLRQNDLLTRFQSGFRRHHNPISALVRVHQDLASHLNRRHFAILTLLDFSKSFDSINHDIFLNKLFNLYSFSSCSVNLFRSYLTGRTQAVKAGDTLSSTLPLFNGIGQGSVLGPLFISSYINDLAIVLSTHHFHFYAGDLQIYDFGNLDSPEPCFARIKELLSSVSSWAAENFLKLNPKKSQALLIRSGKQHPTAFPIFLNGEAIPYVHSARNLGVIFNDSLAWEDHTSHISFDSVNHNVMLEKLEPFVVLRPLSERFKGSLNFSAPTVLNNLLRELGPASLSRTAVRDWLRAADPAQTGRVCGSRYGWRR
ncbi:uncharacterized protein LOC132257068 [Phlebotomus argentipes]|uniref:uncharacterized protein LOC132257068 n=1 Tax=Phlebotomus argentipes TaxID=94469 RepID=UPI002892DD63|nr:uncharacterized protein LOC132257068 [Phlebotomus argentipes]